MTQDRRSEGGPPAGGIALQSLKAKLNGRAIMPGNEGYDLARKVWNGMIDRRPAVIVRAADVADVITAVRFARDQRLDIAVRGGGHNVTGAAVCDGGLVIDMSAMRGIQVDPNGRTARAQGGCTWGDVDRATHAYGLATPGGIISTTGIAGLTLGGGIGHLTRKYGLSCDNVRSAELVTADGRFVTASAAENPDLYWALRGGGGNFGVVTTFEFDLHPVSTVLAGPVLYPLDRAREAMQMYRDYMNEAPDDLNAFFAFLIVPPAPPFPEPLRNMTLCGVVVCYTGPMEQAEAVVKPFRTFGPPALDFLGQMPFPALQSMFDPLVPPGLQNYWKADYVEELTDDVIDIHVKYGPRIPHVSSALHIYPTSGAARRVGKDDTAYYHRKAQYVHVIAAMYPDPADTPKNIAWVREYWTALHPHSTGGGYVNFLMEEGADRIKATYGDNYAKLASIKGRYDPENVFHLNQNVAPVS